MIRGSWNLARVYVTERDPVELFKLEVLHSEIVGDGVGFVGAQHCLTSSEAAGNKMICFRYFFLFDSPVR